MATALKKKPAPNRAVATKQTTAVVGKADMPDYLRKSKGRGNEAVGMADVVIPRLEVVQALSPCLKKNDPAFIAGSEVGDLFNSVTRENYGQTVELIPVIFKKQWLVWTDRRKGGGFKGAFDTPTQAAARIKEEPNPADHEAMETAQQLCLIRKEDGATEEIVVSMSRTKLKVSRQWNSLIRLTTGDADRFTGVYSMFSVDDSNANGDEYKNFGVQFVGYPTEDQYKAAAALYEAIESGKRELKADPSQEGIETADTGGEY